MAASLIIFCAYGILYGYSTSLPGLLQTLFGYDAYHSGLVQSPAGVFSIGVLIVVARLLGKGIDARWFIVTGLIIVAGANYWMSIMNLEISPWQVVWPRVVLVCGLGFIFAPLNVAAYLYIPRELRGAAVGLFSLLRNEGGSVGTSIAQTIQERREQFHLARLGEHLDPFNPGWNAAVHNLQAYFTQMNGDPEKSREMAWDVLAKLRDKQASSLAYFDVFFVAFVIAVCLVAAVFLMKRSVAEKGRACWW